MRYQCPVTARFAIFGLVVGLVAAACGSDEPTADFGRGQPPTTVPVDTAPPVDSAPPSATAAPSTPAATSAPSRGGEAPTTAAVPSTDAPVTVGPLPEPSISLFEIGDFDQPLEVATRPGDNQIYVVEQPGRIVAVTDLSRETVLDITDLTDASGEQGLLGLAFHPTADLAYVHFTDLAGDTVVAELGVDPTTGRFDRDSYREILSVDQPYRNHNGGELAIGPDGLLYVGLGDGGSGGDPQRSALDLTSRLGKILRIDPGAVGDQPFGVPDDNPFVDTPSADPTIWAYGLRNPWRFSFDPVTGDLWVADVGQGDFEEVNHSPATDRRDAGKGVNYGWSALEGFDPFNGDQSDAGTTPPLFVYDHADGRCSVSGGAVARGASVPDLVGWYVFGDYCTGQIWALDPTAPPDQPRVVEIGRLGGLAAIAEGPERDLYAISNSGTVARLIG